MKKNDISILMADDDQDDCVLVKNAFAANLIANRLSFVEDGEELMDYLYNRGRYSDKTLFPLPGLILLDLNMPRKDGHEALREIRADHKLRRISVIVLTTFEREEEILRSYEIGANSFITKPVTFQGLVDAIKILSRYWFEIVKLPGKRPTIKNYKNTVST
jgi:CheY-like chemotaxis protein